MSSIIESYDDITKSIASYRAPKQIFKRGKPEPSHNSKCLNEFGLFSKRSIQRKILRD